MFKRFDKYDLDLAANCFIDNILSRNETYSVLRNNVICIKREDLERKTVMLIDFIYDDCIIYTDDQNYIDEIISF